MGIPDHLTCLLKNLYASQEATVRTGHGTNLFEIGKGVRQGCILSLCLFNLYAEYIMRNAGLDEAQSGIKIAGRNINNLKYAHDTPLMAESKEELKSLLMKMRVAKGTFSCKDGLNRGQKWYGPNRSRRYEEEAAQIHRRTIQKKDHHDPENDDGVVTPDV